MARRGSLRAGFQALSYGKLVLLLTATTVLLAVTAAVPLSPALSQSFAGTLAGDHILRNHPTFAPTDVLDFLRERSDAIAATWRAALWAALLGLALQIFFTGGFVAVIGRSEPFSFTDFFAAAKRNFWHNVKCFVLFLIPSSILLVIWFAAARAASQKLFEDAPPGTLSAFLFRLGILLVALLLYVVFSLFQDFARAARRSQAQIGAWRAYGLARRTLQGRWTRALGLFFFWLLLGAVALLSLVAFEWSRHAVSALAILLLFLFQIGILAIRPAVRVATWGSYLALFDSAQPKPALTQRIRQSPPPLQSAPAAATLDDRPLV